MNKQDKVVFYKKNVKSCFLTVKPPIPKGEHRVTSYQLPVAGYRCLWLRDHVSMELLKGRYRADGEESRYKLGIS